LSEERAATDTDKLAMVKERLKAAGITVGSEQRNADDHGTILRLSSLDAVVDVFDAGICDVKGPDKGEVIPALGDLVGGRRRGSSLGAGSSTSVRKRPGLEDSVAAADRLFEKDGVVEVDLATAEQLVSEPSIEPLGRDGPYQSGAAYASSVLQSVRRLPDQITVRVALNTESFDERTNAEAELAFRDYCRFRAEDAWRQAATVRRTGIRQLPRALAVSAAAAAVAAACGSVGANLDGKTAAALLYVVAGIGAIASWVIIWLPIEQWLFDWRPSAHVAAVFDLLSRARLEFIQRAAGDR